MKRKGLYIEIALYLIVLFTSSVCFFFMQKNDLIMLLIVRFGYSMKYTLISLFLLYFGVKYLVDLIFFLKDRWRHHQWSIHLFTVFIFLIIVSVNIFPMVYWIKYFQQIKLLPIYLILSNMLLYYFCLHTYREVLNESKKPYIVSARFKQASEFNYLKEKRQWVMYNNMRPMFYHLFSFTLFTDMVALEDYPEYRGIVGYIFVELKESTDTFSLELILALIITGLFIYPIKRCLEVFEYNYTRNKAL